MIFQPPISGVSCCGAAERWFVDLRCMRANEGDCQAESSERAAAAAQTASSVEQQNAFAAAVLSHAPELHSTADPPLNPELSARLLARPPPAGRTRQHPKLLFFSSLNEPAAASGLTAASKQEHTHQIQTISLVSPLLPWHGWVAGWV